MTINPNNYPGIEATIVGFVAGDPENPRYDKEGTRGRKQISIPVNHGYKNKDTGEFVATGTTWIQYTANDEFLAGIKKGAKVRIDGAKLESREHNGKTYFDAMFGTIAVLSEPQAKGDPPF